MDLHIRIQPVECRRHLDADHVSQRRVALKVDAAVMSSTL